MDGKLWVTTREKFGGISTSTFSSKIKIKKRKITGSVKSLYYKPSPIPSGGLEIPLQLTFSYPVEWVRDKMM